MMRSPPRIRLIAAREGYSKGWIEGAAWTRPYKVARLYTYGDLLETAVDTKLTLKLDSEVIEKAKAYAESRGESLSRLVETYFAGLVSGEQTERSQLRGVVAELAGILASAEIDDEKEAYADYLSKKYA
jgi:hypothetical protein